MGGGGRQGFRRTKTRRLAPQDNSTMVLLDIDIHNNSVLVRPPSGEPWRAEFSRRWEAVLLASLMEEGKHRGVLAADTLQARLRQLGQAKPLNRAQLQRLLESLQAFLDRLPEVTARIEFAPRKHTVGPWRLVHDRALNVVGEGVPEGVGWAHVGLLADNGLENLHRLLSTMLVADALAVEGLYPAAVSALKDLNMKALSPEGRGLVRLRLCGWYRHLGQFGLARDTARSVLDDPAPLDPGLSSYAQLLLQRIGYDENPAQNWMPLWQSTAPPPALTPSIGGDWRSLSEWHNLRALLARRRMQHIDGQVDQGRRESGESGEVIGELHGVALRHFQAALYIALWSRDWDRVQAYVANLSFHLQACLALRQALGITPGQVLIWHRLTMAYEDKLGAGLDSAWEYIFFAEFWLAHAGQLRPGLLPDPISHHLGGTAPDQPAFYERALQRLRECGDDRQVAIGHSLYLQFAQDHMAGGERDSVMHTQAVQLTDLLSRQTTSHLRDSMVAEGYTRHWPPTLQQLLERKGRLGPRWPAA